MTTTPLMLLVLPTDHGSSGTWDVILDTVFGLVDGHDHTTGKGAQIPMTGLKVSADLSFSFGGVSRSITDLKAIDFSAQAASGMTALAGALFLNSADNELYYRTTGGTNVKITSGTTLNVAGFTGGIGGDYAGSGALVEFTDSIDSYKFEQETSASVRQYARLQSADVDLFEYKAAGATPVPTNRVRLQSPVSLAASYALTMPAAVPAATAIVQVSAAGVLTATNAIVDNIAMAVNKNVTVSGTGKFKHPTITDALSPWGAIAGNVNSPVIVMNAGAEVLQLTGSAAGAFFNLPLRLRVGANVSAIRARILDNVTGPTKVVVTFTEVVDGVVAFHGSAGPSLGTAAWQTMTITPGGGLIVVAGTAYHLRFALSNSNSACFLNHVEVDYDQP